MALRDEMGCSEGNQDDFTDSVNFIKVPWCDFYSGLFLEILGEW